MKTLTEQPQWFEYSCPECGTYITEYLKRNDEKATLICLICGLLVDLTIENDEVICGDYTIDVEDEEYASK